MAENGYKPGVNKAPKVGLKHLLPYTLIFVAAPILSFITGRWVDETLRLPKFPPFPLNLYLGLSVFLFGLTIGLVSTRTLYRLGHGLPWGELIEQARSRRLVTSGIYTYCRNPMTLGYALLPCGMGILFQSLGITVFIPTAVFTVMIMWLKLWEEPKLEKRFGSAYREYKLTTPFLVPRHTQLSKFFLSLMLKLRQTMVVEELARLKWLVSAYVGISITGLIFLTALAFNNPGSFVELTFRKQLTFSILTIICIVGAVAGTRPLKFFQMRPFNTLKRFSEVNSRKPQEPAKTFLGHHPVCGQFYSHTLQFRGKTYCAACTGLVTGAVIVILGILLYLLTGLPTENTIWLIFWLGFLGVTCGLLQFHLHMNRGVHHFLLNLIFVLGVFLLFIGISEANSSLFMDFYLLALTIYWINTLINLSELEHKKTCSACGLEACRNSF